MNSYFDKAIGNLVKWIKIKSVKESPDKNAPFGKGISKMLNVALQDASALGFECKNYDGYVGEVIFGDGDDEKGLAVLCHLDVVPEGDEKSWKFPPYSAKIENGVLYGRGVVDDKAPACLCLYALKELKDRGFVPNRKIKLILGCDEESGWACMEHYKKVAVMPDEGFSPDGDFPVLYAEKGILHVEYLFPIDKRVESVVGGERVNVVCDSAVAVINENVVLKGIDNLKVDGCQVSAKGKSAHGSTPELGENAIKKLLKVFVENELFDKETYNNLFEDALNLSNIQDETGVLTFSPNVVRASDGVLSLKVDVRYPSTKNCQEIIGELEKIGKFKILHHQKPLYSDSQGKLVKTLLGVYNKITGEDAKPITTGGGTYARALKNGVAFGPSFKGEAKCHVPNECASLLDLEKCYEIYKTAIKTLCE